MRFRKSVKLCKGVRLNFSGSGVSMSLGVKGASVSIGKRGAYLNYGIPGTGLYDRVKIANGSSTGRSKRTSSYHSLNEPMYSYTYDIFIDDRGQTSLEVKDQYGNIVTNSSIISKIRRSPEYKNRLDAIIAKKRDDVNEQTLSLLHIYKLSENLVDFDSIKEAYNNLLSLPSPEECFDVPYPSREDVRNQLIKDAETKISSIFFWTNKRKREEFVQSNLDLALANEIKEWELQKDCFVNAEKSLREEEKIKMEKILQTDIEGIYASIEEVLQNISLPVEFSLNYEIENSSLYLDLDLPEIEDMPLEKVSTLSSGKISIKQKTIKEQSADYAICVCGMSYFFASLLFNTTPEVDDIYISAYTQRENKQSGRTEDQYVYSVKFDRSKFASLDFQSLDPIMTLCQFPHNIKISSSYKLETIDINKPLSTEVDIKLSSVIKPATIKSQSINADLDHAVVSSVEKLVDLYDPITEEKVKVVIPSGSILVQIPEDDRTIYCLDEETYFNLEEYLDKKGKKYIVVKKKKWQEAVAEMTMRKEKEREEALTASINNEGIALEKDGNEDEAILVYEKNITRKCTARHSYDRLLVLYRKRKDVENELRIAKLANSIFPGEKKYKLRLEGLFDGGDRTETLPKEAIAFVSEIKHGDIFEERILKLPEFDYYNNGGFSNVNKIKLDTLDPIREIQKYFRDLLDAAELAESRKDYENAALIYEKIVGENYWMPSACDRLVKIYSKAKLKDAEIRVLENGIKYFSELREKRLIYVKALAKKYGAESFLNERINNGGKITYYHGSFELYNPFPIVEKWQERLKKKLD